MIVQFTNVYRIVCACPGHPLIPCRVRLQPGGEMREKPEGTMCLHQFCLVQDAQTYWMNLDAPCWPRRIIETPQSADVLFTSLHIHWTSRIAPAFTLVQPKRYFWFWSSPRRNEAVSRPLANWSLYMVYIWCIYSVYMVYIWLIYG